MGVQGGVGQRRSKPMGGFQRKKENRFPHCSIKILAENRNQILIVSVARCGHRFDNDMKISFFGVGCIGRNELHWQHITEAVAKKTISYFSYSHFYVSQM